MKTRNNCKYRPNLTNYSRVFSYITPILLIISVFISTINDAYLDKVFNFIVSTIYLSYVISICIELDKIKVDRKKVDFSELFTILLEYHCAHWLVLKDNNSCIFNVVCFFIAIIIYIIFILSKKATYSCNAVLFSMMTLIQLFLSYNSGSTNGLIFIITIFCIVIQAFYLLFNRNK